MRYLTTQRVRANMIGEAKADPEGSARQHGFKGTTRKEGTLYQEGDQKVQSKVSKM